MKKLICFLPKLLYVLEDGETTFWVRDLENSVNPKLHLPQTLLSVAVYLCLKILLRLLLLIRFPLMISYLVFRLILTVDLSHLIARRLMGQEWKTHEARLEKRHWLELELEWIVRE